MSGLDQTPAAIIDAAQLRRQRRVRVVLDGTEVVVVATHTGPRVWPAVCPHLGGPLAEASFADGVVRCPWHGYAFRLSDGACLTVPGRPWREGHRCWGLGPGEWTTTADVFPGRLELFEAVEDGGRWIIRRREGA